MTAAFVDTNILLHAKPLQDIPWESLAPAPIVIIITKTNIRELDKHKDQHPKKHIRERARKALQRIESASSNAEIRTGVMLQVDHRSPRIDWESNELDASYPDDALIASVLEYQTNHPGEAVVLLTHDVGPRLTAARLGITARELPESEKLPPERDETEKENERLKKELHELKAAAPQLALEINGKRDKVEVQTLRAAYAARDDDAIFAEAAAARDKLPSIDVNAIPQEEKTPVTRDSKGRLVLDLDAPEPDWNAIPRKEYLRYQRQREEYAAEYAAYLRAFDAAAVTWSRTVRFDLSLDNDGGMPAEDIVITIEVPPHVTVSLVPPAVPSPPEPPEEPRSQQILFSDSVAKPLPFTSGDLHSRMSFLRDSEPDIDGSTVTWSRHSLKHQFVANLGKLYATQAGAIAPFAIRYSIHAANAVKPFEGKIVIQPREP